MKKWFSTKEADSKAEETKEPADPKKIGFQDAFNSGWYQRETGELLKGFPIAPEDTVLDVGCGEGLASLFCASQGAHVVFTDVDAKKIESLKEKALRSKARKVEAYASDSMPLPLENEYASKVLAMEMLEHTEDPKRILQELVRVGKPGAQYLITVPDERSERLQKPFADPIYFQPPNHIQLFDKKRFCHLVESAGLIIEKHMTWGFFWVMWMSIFWTIGSDSEDTEKEALGLIHPPYHEALQRWTDTWQEVMQTPKGRSLAEAFNQTLPKAQAIIARKPE